MFSIYSNLLDYIFYKKCYLCGNKTKSGLLCLKCFKKIEADGFKELRTFKGIKIEGYYFYKEEIKSIIRGFKYHNKRELAADTAKILYNLTQKEEFSEENTEIIPVPLHNDRQKKRKYNQTELIANEFAALAGCTVNAQLIKRVKNTPPQYNLSQKERKENLKGAFRVFPEFYTGKKLVLLDDISTTGATLQEMIKELQKNGIENISGLVIAFSGN
ncbi:MAG TPA: ComF family protein [Candidatus Gastranaerophilales bacterium]|nr:ComF family protein [Candidatus Gastranaerophilales bacterium]